MVEQGLWKPEVAEFATLPQTELKARMDALVRQVVGKTGASKEQINAIIVSPIASQSKPSIRFIAFIIPTIQKAFHNFIFPYQYSTNLFLIFILFSYRIIFL